MPTHGALTKAGKVRSQTPFVEAKPYKPNRTPMKRMRENHNKRILNAKPRRGYD